MACAIWRTAWAALGRCSDMASICFTGQQVQQGEWSIRQQGWQGKQSSAEALSYDMELETALCGSNAGAEVEVWE